MSSLTEAALTLWVTPVMDGSGTCSPTFVQGMTLRGMVDASWDNWHLHLLA